MLILIASSVVGFALLAAAALWYFSPKKRAERAKVLIRAIAQAQQNLLTAARIRFFPYNRDSGTPGIYVRQRDLAQACATMGVYILATFKDLNQRPIEVAVRRKVEEDPSLVGFQVRCTLNFGPNLSDAREKTVALLREIVLPVVKRNINIFDMHGSVAEPSQGEDFNIYVHSAPSAEDSVRVPLELFGIEQDQRFTAFAPSGDGILLVDSASGHAFGEVIGRTLYIYHALLPTTPTLLVTLAAALETAAPDLNCDLVLDEVVSSVPRDNLPVREGRIIAYGFRYHKRNIVNRLIRDILLPAVSTDICVRNCAGTHQAKADTAFHVIYHGSPTDAVVCGTAPTGIGVPILNVAGQCAAELFPGNLFIADDLLGAGRKADIAKLAEVLYRVRRELVAEHSFNGARMLREQFAQVCLQQISAVNSKTPEQARQALDSAEAELERVLQVARSAERELVHLDWFPEERLKKEFDDLRRISKVRDVRVTDSAIVVETEMLYCKVASTGVTYRIGEFEISIPTRFGNGIRFLNKTGLVETRRASMNAPHVDGSGNACLGNTQGMFSELLLNRQYASAVQMAIIFLQSVNITDVWGKDIVYWPIEPLGERALDRRDGNTSGGR